MNTQNTFLEGCFVIDVASSGYSLAVSAYGHDEKSVIELCLREGLFNKSFLFPYILTVAAVVVIKVALAS